MNPDLSDTDTEPCTLTGVLFRLDEEPVDEQVVTDSGKRLGVSLAVSGCLHALILLGYIDLSTITSLPKPVPVPSLAVVIMPPELPVTPGLPPVEVQVPAEPPYQEPVVSPPLDYVPDAVTEAVLPTVTEADRDSVADSPVSLDQLEQSLDAFISAYRSTGQQRWMSGCWQQRQQTRERHCPDEDLVVSALDQVRQDAPEQFRSVSRSDLQTAVLNSLADERRILEGLESQSGLIGFVASRRADLLKRRTAYLSGNYNDNYALFLRNAFSGNPMVNAMMYQASPGCGAGKCIFEYTPPGGIREEPEDRSPRFELAVPDMPFTVMKLLTGDAVTVPSESDITDTPAQTQESKSER